MYLADRQLVFSNCYQLEQPLNYRLGIGLAPYSFIEVKFGQQRGIAMAIHLLFFYNVKSLPANQLEAFNKADS